MTPEMYCIKLHDASGFEHGYRSAGVRHLCKLRLRQRKYAISQQFHATINPFRFLVQKTCWPEACPEVQHGCGNGPRRSGCSYHWTNSNSHQNMSVQSSAKRRSSSLVNFVTALALPLLPGFACSIHATWGPPLSWVLYIHFWAPLSANVIYGRPFLAI